MLKFTFSLFLIAFVSIGAANRINGAEHWSNLNPESSLSSFCNNTDLRVILLDGYDAFKPQLSFSNSSEHKIGRGFSNDIGYFPEIAKGISDCQRQGIEVMLSLQSYPEFSSRGAAVEHSDHLWKVFGPKQPKTRKSRPFGDVALDGIHVVLPPRTDYYLDFIKHFRDMQPNIKLGIQLRIPDLVNWPVFAGESRVDYKLVDAYTLARYGDDEGIYYDYMDEKFPTGVTIWDRYYSGPNPATL